MVHFLTKYALEQLTTIHVVADEDQSVLARLKLNTPVYVCGDTRYDQAIFRTQYPKKLPLQIISNEQPILVVGSSYENDENLILESLHHQPDWRVIFVPHESSRSRQLYKNINNEFETPDLLTEISEWGSRFLLVNQTGWLAELYQFADLTYVGGGLHNKVHSVMEPLCFGKHVCIGPKHLNNREAILFKDLQTSKAPIVQVINNSASLTSILEKFKSRDLQSGTEILSQVYAHAGATKTTLAWIKEYL